MILAMVSNYLYYIILQYYYLLQILYINLILTFLQLLQFILILTSIIIDYINCYMIKCRYHYHFLIFVEKSSANL